MDINKIAKEMTREEFLNNIECDEVGFLFRFFGKDDVVWCPIDHGLEDSCGAERHCKNDCWRNAVKNIKFKGEE